MELRPQDGQRHGSPVLGVQTPGPGALNPSQVSGCRATELPGDSRPHRPAQVRQSNQTPHRAGGGPSDAPGPPWTALFSRPECEGQRASRMQHVPSTKAPRAYGPCQVCNVGTDRRWSPPDLPAPSVRRGQVWLPRPVPSQRWPRARPRLQLGAPLPGPTGRPFCMLEQVGRCPQRPHTRHPSSDPNLPPTSSPKHTPSLTSWMRDRFSERRSGWRGRGLGHWPVGSPRQAALLGDSSTHFSGWKERNSTSPVKCSIQGPDSGKVTHHAVW